jgi:CRP-like cAMP-binding protein
MQVYIVENDTKSLERFEEGEIPTNLVINSLLFNFKVKDFTHEQSKLIKHHPIFDGIESKSFYIDLFDHIDHQLYMPGDYIINKGDYGQGIYFIVSGNVLCYSSNERVVLLNLTEGDWFGEKSLVFLTKNTQTFVADTFCTCFFISKINFDKILLRFPHISTKISAKRTKKLS